MRAGTFLFTFLFFWTIRSVEYMGACNDNQHCYTAYSPRYSCINNKCRHEPLDLSSLKQIIGVLLIVVIAGLTNAGGIGGGAVIVPVYLFTMEYSIGDSVPLAKATIFGGAIVTLFANFSKRHPTNSFLPLNDYKIASFIVPLMLSGSLIGVMLTKILPSAFILFCMVTYLLTSSYQIYFKATAYSRKEIEAMKKKKQTPVEIPQTQQLRLFDRSRKASNASQICEEDDSSMGLSSPVEAAPPTWAVVQPYFFNIAVCLLSYLVILTVAVLRGGKGFASLVGIDYCSKASFFILLGGEFICIGIAVLVVLKERLNFKPKPIEISPASKELDISRPESELEVIEQIDQSLVPSRNTLFTFCKVYFGGMLAGMIGIGGGVVVNPFLLGIGYPPEIAATISGFIVLFTSLSTSTQFMIAGAYDLKNSFFIFIFSVLGSYFGKKYIDSYIVKSGRPSLLVWILLFITLISAVVLPSVGIFKILHEENPFSIGHICET